MGLNIYTSEQMLCSSSRLVKSVLIRSLIEYFHGHTNFYHEVHRCRKQFHSGGLKHNIHCDHGDLCGMHVWILIKSRGLNIGGPEPPRSPPPVPMPLKLQALSVGLLQQNASMVTQMAFVNLQMLPKHRALMSPWVLHLLFRTHAVFQLWWF